MIHSLLITIIHGDFMVIVIVGMTHGVMATMVGVIHTIIMATLDRYLDIAIQRDILVQLIIGMDKEDVSEAIVQFTLIR